MVNDGDVATLIWLAPEFKADEKQKKNKNKTFIKLIIDHEYSALWILKAWLKFYKNGQIVELH